MLTVVAVLVLMLLLALLFFGGSMLCVVWREWWLKRSLAEVRAGLILLVAVSLMVTLTFGLLVQLRRWGA